MELEEGPSRLPHLLRLCDDIRAYISDYLTPSNWRELRLSCKDALQWPKREPKFDYRVDYRVIVFAISNQFDQTLVGLAKTPADIREAGLQLWKTMDRRGNDSLSVRFSFLDFPINEKSPIIPIVSYETAAYYEQAAEIFGLHEIGKDYFDVKDVDACGWDYSSKFYSWGYGSDDIENLPAVGSSLHSVIEWFGAHGPRTDIPIDLRNFGVREDCAHTDGFFDRPYLSWCALRNIPFDALQECENNGYIWYNPKWYSAPARRASYQACSTGNIEDIRWLIFNEEVRLWDK